MQTQTKDLFIFNENYPLNSEMYKKYSEKLGQCNKDEKCVSWVKYDIEGELKGYALKVGVKLDGSEESNFSGAAVKEKASHIADRAKAIPPAVAIVLVILLVLAVYKKSWILGGSAAALGLLILMKPELVGTEVKTV